ncbi:MAG: CotH kinase family protein [Kiritimatiellae bacterium]|nr:CotH kinase family protein [Kiritimatiellia bacterium]
MHRIRGFVVSTLFASACMVCAGTSSVQLANTPYINGLSENSSGVYRIPAMAKSTNGVIVAVSDCRNNSSEDLPNSIDIAEVWSGDNGVKWSTPRVGIDVANDGDVRKLRDIGDPCMLYDPVGNKFWLMAITGGGLASSHDSSGNSRSDVVLYTRGTGENDAWQEWTGGPEGNRRSVKQMILDSLAEVDPNATNDEDRICGILQGPGHGIVQRQMVFALDGETVLMPKDALVFPMQYFSTKRSENSSSWAAYSWAFAVYSTDGGATWKSTKLAPTQKAQESCVMELDDGSWVMMAKCQSGGERYFFRTTDYLNWTKHDSLSPSAACQGSCLWLGKGADGKSRYVSCFAANGDRSNITLHFGTDNSADKMGLGIMWGRSYDRVIQGSTSGLFAYNSLVMVDGDTLGTLLEVGGHLTFRTEDIGAILENDIAAVIPVAVWDGDFGVDALTNFTSNGYTLVDWNETHGKYYSSVTIDRTNQGLMFNSDTPMSGLTVLVRYSGLEASESAKHVLFASCVTSNHKYDRTGVQLNPNGTLVGLWNNSTSSCNDADNGDASGSIPSSGVMAFTYSTAGTYLYYGASSSKISSTATWGSSALKSSNDTSIYGAAIGGMCADSTKSSTEAAKGMTINAVAVFDCVLTAEQMRAYKWPAAPEGSLVVEINDSTVKISNTNATSNKASWSPSAIPTISMPLLAHDDLTEGTYIKLDSLDVGFVEDTSGNTHPKMIAISSGTRSWTSLLVTTNSADRFSCKDSNTYPRLVYSFAEANCVLTVGETYSVSLLDASGAPMSGKIRYALSYRAQSIFSGLDFSADYTPMFQLTGEIVSEDDLGFVDPCFDWTPGSAPTGSWFTAWKGENGGSPKTVVGPDGAAQSIQVTYRNGNNDTWTPYCSDAAKPLTNFTFITYGSADMVTADSGKYAVLWCMGQKDNAKTALVKDSDGNICLVQITGAEVAPARTITAGPVKGYHVFTVRFNQVGGASLQIDDGQIMADSNFTTVAHAGFQVGSVRGGCNGPLEVGSGFAVLKMLAFPTNEIPEEQYAALCAQYPSVTAMSALEYNVAGGSLYMPSLTLSSGQLRIKSGTLEVPAGVEASLSALEFGDKEGNPSFGMNLAGKITINTASTGSDNNFNSAYSDCNNGRGVDLGEWTGTGTHNISGSFIASNTIVEVCHDSSSVTTTIDGGEFVVKGITSRHANRVSLVLTGGGMLNLGEYPSCTAAIAKTYGDGTVTGTASWTDTDDIVFNGTGETGTTIFADGIHLKFTGALSGAGKVTIDAPNDGSVEFSNYQGTGDIVVKEGTFVVPCDASFGRVLTLQSGATLDIQSETGDLSLIETIHIAALSVVVAEGAHITVDGESLPEWMTLDTTTSGITIYNTAEKEIADECVLRISEIMPKPTDARTLNGMEGMDVNGLESGWVEVENTSDKWADLADYRFIRVNRGKKTDPAGVGNFPSRLVPPHGRAIFYTSERYSNSKDKKVSAFAEGTFDGKPMIFEDYGNVLVWGDKVNPKKSPYVRLYYAPGGDSDKGTVVDTVVVPSDLPEGWSIIVGDAAEGEGTRRWMCPTPTRGRANTATSGLVRIGPNVGPLYERPDQKKTDIASEFAVNAPPAVPGTDYTVTLPINAVMNPDGTFTPRAADRVQSIKFVYRKDLDDATLVTNEVNMAAKTTDANWGDRYSATIPASYFPAAGHLMQWKVLITDGEGVEWTSPSFNNKDDGYEWYGTIVEPGELNSATLPTWHMFASGNHLTQMNVDADKQNRSLVPNQARIAIYDSSTSNYYDYVRIDLRGNTSASFTKKGHGLRFAKAHPLTMRDVVSGEDIEEIRKTSLISEFADPSFMRQMIAFWLWRKMGNLVPFDFPVRCNLNGEFYQLAFNSERFTDELIEDVYGLDKFGYGYKNVGTLKSGSGTTAGGIEKKTPDDEDESNITVLQSELRSKITAAQNVSGTSEAAKSSTTTDTTGLDNASLTKFVVQKFDLPAWLNYLASAKITQEMDDVWANICAYYDNPDMLQGARGKGTWMPLGYDFNISFGQYYQGDIGSKIGLMSNQDWFKSHPFYGGNRVRCWKGTGMGTSVNYGNDGFEAVWQSSKFRRLYLRRLRTLMDQELKEPGTPESEVPFMVKMREMADLMRADSVLDLAKWPDDGSDSAIDVWPSGARPVDMDAGINEIWDDYVVPRREHLYVTHSVTNTTKVVGYGSNLNAGIPEAQSPITTLAPNIYVSNLTALDAEQAEALGVTGQFYGTEVVIIQNDNAEAVDMSGWRLAFSVDFTFPAGTVCDANDSIYIVADRRDYIRVHGDELTDQVIVGNATFTGAGPIAIFAADGTQVFAAIPETNEKKYLRLHSFCGNTNDGADGDTGEWFTLTNISDAATLDLADVTVCFLKQGDDHDTTTHCHVTLTNKKGKGDVKPLKSWTANQADWADNGWPKIQNNKQQITIYDKFGTVCQTLKVTQKDFLLAYGAGGWLVCDSQDALVTDKKWWHQAFDISAGTETGSFEAKNQADADKAAADITITLSAEDAAAGLETQYLKVVAEPVEGSSGKYKAVVVVNPETVGAPVVGVGESAAEDKPVKVEDVVGGKEVSVSITNAVKGLWYGCEVADGLGATAAFGNDVGSFYRASNTTHTVIASPRTQPSGFFRVKVLPVRPTE